MVWEENMKLQANGYKAMQKHFIAKILLLEILVPYT